MEKLRNIGMDDVKSWCFFPIDQNVRMVHNTNGLLGRSYQQVNEIKKITHLILNMLIEKE